MMTSTDLRQCVQLLASILDTDGLELGVTSKRRPVHRAMVKPKKKGSHLNPKPRAISSKATTGVKGRHARKTMKSTSTAPGDQQRSHQLRQATAALLAPFNSRLASSTPNSTLVQKPTSQDPIRTKRNPGLPLVVIDDSYSLTTGQSNPLNASDQVDLIHPPPEPELEPKLFAGRVEFQPNPVPFYPVGRVEPSRGPPTLPGSYIRVQGESEAVIKPLSLAEQYTADANVAEKENAAEGYSLYSGNPQIQSYMSLHSIEDISQTDLAKGGEPEKFDTRPSGKTPRVGIHAADPKVKAAILSLKSALRQEANNADAKPAKSQKTAPKSKPKKKRSSKHQTCPRCSTLEAKSPRIVVPAQEILQKPSDGERTVQFALRDISAQVSSLSNSQVTPRVGSDGDCRKTGEPRISTHYIQHMETLQRLLEDLKSTTRAEHDVELHSLATQVEQAAAMFVPGLGGVEWQTELELAVQPLRSENAQLRRKLRILNQQLREKSSAPEPSENSSMSYHIVELEVQNKTLHQQLAEVRTASDHLTGRSQALQAQIDLLTRDKVHFMDILANKDEDRKAVEASLQAEIEQLKLEEQQLHKTTQDALLQRSATNGQTEILRVSLQQRDREINRLRSLVKNLQASMTRLLGNLKTMSLSPEGPNYSHKRKNKEDLSAMETMLNDISTESLDEEPHQTSTMHPDPKLPSSEVQNCPSANAIPAAPRRTLNYPNEPSKGHPSTQKKLSNPVSSSTVTSSPKGQGHPETNGGHADSWVNGELDTTDYILAPGSSPIKVHASSSWIPQELGEKPEIVTTPTHGHKVSGHGTPTVKELLTPLANRLQDQYKRLSLAGAKNPDPVAIAPEDSSLEVVPLDDTLTASEATDAGDVTPTEVTDLGTDDVEDLIQRKPSDVDLSRYSMTDYFRKYSRSPVRDTRQTIPKQVHSPDNQMRQEEYTDEERLTSDGSDRISDEFSGDLDPIRATNDRSLASKIGQRSNLVGHVEARSGSLLGHMSLQESMYKGTELDTSISTIDDLLSIASTSLTVSSVGTVDDSAFRQGLADLDANIAKIQQQLKDSLG